MNNLFVLGMFDTVLSIYKFRGLAGFGAGLQARVMYQMPAAALAWSVYELFKFILSDGMSNVVFI